MHVLPIPVPSFCTCSFFLPACMPRTLAYNL
jgi:hypothetical protein